MRVGNKIFFVMTILVVISSILVYIIGNNEAKESIYSIARKANQSNVSNEYNSLSNLLEEMEHEVTVLISDKAVSDFVSGNNDETKQALSETLDIYERQNKVERINVLDNKGCCLYSTSEKTEFGDVVVDVSTVMNNSGFSHIYNSDNDKKETVFSLTQPVKSGSETLGYLNVVYRCSEIKKSLEGIAVMEYSKIFLIDSADNILESPFVKVVALSNKGEYADIKNAVSHANSSQSNNFSTDYKFERHLKNISTYRIEDAGWTIIGIVDLNPFYYEYSNDSPFKAAIPFVAAVIIFFFANAMTKPVREIVAFLESRSKGHVQAKLDFNSNDEYGIIANKFNNLFDDLMSSDICYKTIAEISDNIIFDIDLLASTLKVSNSFDKKFSFRPVNETLNESFIYKMKVHKDDLERFNAERDEFLFTKNPIWEGEYRLISKYDEYNWIQFKAKKIYDHRDEPYRIVGVLLDIDRKKEKELNLIRKANFDALTGLYKREVFIEMVDEKCRTVNVGRKKEAVMFIDLDDFKHFNDNYGHKCGDEVLVYTAETIMNMVKGHGFGGRFGGDEFILYSSGFETQEEIGAFADELIRVLHIGFVSESVDEQIAIGCSIGIAVFKENGNDSSEIIAEADAAMYKIKKHGKSSYAFAIDGDKLTDNISEIGKHIDSDDKESDKD